MEGKTHMLHKPKGKKKMYRQWNQGQVSCEECRDTAWLCRRGQEGQGTDGAELGKEYKKIITRFFYRYVSPEDQPHPGL